MAEQMNDQEVLAAIRLGVLEGRRAAKNFIEQNEYVSPYDCFEMSETYRPLFNAAWYRTYDPLIAGEPN